jgi:hypothetical protein
MDGNDKNNFSVDPLPPVQANMFMRAMPAMETLV